MRQELPEVLDILRTNKVSITSELETVHSIPDRLDMNVNVSVNTQVSVNVLTEVEKFFSQITVNNDLTKIHNQKHTNLCHSYSVISGLRLVLRNFLTRKIQDASLLDVLLEDFEPKKGSSFYKMLAVFIGSVNPRAFDGLFKKSAINKLFSYNLNRITTV